MHFFTIITASYNSEKTIADTIKSVLAQTYTDFEYIIVDGASKDATVAIIQSFQNDFESKKITYKFISEKDKGIYDAWNKGVQLAQGQWISFLGSDDTYYPNALERYAHHILINSNINYISSQIELINRNKEILQTFGNKFVYEKAVRDIDTAQVGSFHKKELLDGVGPFNTDYKIVGDLEFYIRSKDIIIPAHFNEVTAQMLNEGVSNNIYPALKEALNAKLHLKAIPKITAYYNFYLSLLKCYVKIMINRK